MAHDGGAYPPTHAPAGGACRATNRYGTPPRLGCLRSYCPALPATASLCLLGLRARDATQIRGLARSHEPAHRPPEKAR